MEQRITPEQIDELPKNFIFVFGSNESGIHGAGAAKKAIQFGANYSQGYGASGSTFAIPTKDWMISQLDLDSISHYVKRFIEFVKVVDDSTKFYVTKIGCGLAGYAPEQIAPMFAELIDNEKVWLPEDFIKVIKNLKNDKEITNSEME